MALTVAFTIDEHRLALPVALVTQVTRAASITVAPNAPAMMMGVVDFHGEVVPVMNIRARLGLEVKPMALSDHMVLVRTPTRAIACVVDRVLGLVEWGDGDVVCAKTLMPDVTLLAGIARDKDGLILLYDPDTFLQVEETSLLTKVLTHDG